MLYDFQQTVKNGIYSAWQGGAMNVMPVCPTGSGKTAIFCDILRELQAPSCVIAHRQELIGQAALALNRERVPHGIMAPREVIQQVVALQMNEYGYSMYSTRAAVRVAGVDTLARESGADRWFKQVQYVVQDEGHHVLKTNKWGKAMGIFPSARGLFPTAHAVRADGAGLGRGADGLVDALVVGPTGRELIDRGYLTDYDIVCPPSDIDVSDVPLTPTGDFSIPKLRDKVHKSKQLVGDIVQHYRDFAPGALGITFAVDIEEAAKIATAYRKAHVHAEVITGKTPIGVRGKLMRMFRERDILQLVAVDVLGEGVDVPAVEVVSMGRHTASWQLYCQQFGRMLRVSVDKSLFKQWSTFTDAQRLGHIAASKKPRSRLIDHVGNVARHYEDRGLPDSPQVYDLAKREKRSRVGMKDEIPLKTCLNAGPPACLKPYETVLTRCPYCGFKPEPRGRGSPEQVEGNLILLDPRVLQAMHAAVAKIDSDLPTYPMGGNLVVNTAVARNHRERQGAQRSLRDAIALWAGYHRHLGRDDEEIHKRFYHKFKIDILSAQAIGRTDAELLEQSVRAEIWVNGVIAA